MWMHIQECKWWSNPNATVVVAPSIHIMLHPLCSPETDKTPHGRVCSGCPAIIFRTQTGLMKCSDVSTLHNMNIELYVYNVYLNRNSSKGHCVL